MNETMMCCHMECTKEAEYEIINGPTSDDYTHACRAHVMDLLTNSRRHHIVPLGVKGVAYVLTTDGAYIRTKGESS